MSTVRPNITTVHPNKQTPTSKKFNWERIAIPTLKIINLIIIARILQREEHITLSLGIDLAAHALTVITTSTSHGSIKFANVSTNSLRALTFLYGAAEAPLGTVFGLFAVGIHAVNALAGLSLCDKRFTHWERVNFLDHVFKFT